MRRVLITTGDLRGIGLEVTVKALFSLGPQRGVRFFVFSSSIYDAYAERVVSRLKKKFKIISATDLSSALALDITEKTALVFIRSVESPARWVEQSALACFEGRADAMATGPLSKPEIIAAGFSDLGHTEILKRITKSKHAYMTFLGKHFNVLLATGHLPISEVSKSLSKEQLLRALESAHGFLPFLSRRQRKLPIAVLGLNPHAGDSGLIGTEEANHIVPLLNSLKMTPSAVGPLVPDVAFLKQNWQRYSFYVSCYHDQGLIPFKMIHGFDSGVHLTLGLPIWRTSVDHGTAFDIYGKNLAKPNSMIEAVKWAAHLAGGPHV